jgi:hypothetical protein
MYNISPALNNDLEIFDEWSTYMDRLTTFPQEIIVNVELNFEFDNSGDAIVRQFIRQLGVRRIKHIRCAYNMSCQLHYSKDSFIQASAILSCRCGATDGLVEIYNSGPKALIDKHVPLDRTNITFRPNAPWYTKALREAKHRQGKAERLWRRIKLTIHHQQEQVSRGKSVIDRNV